MRDRLFFNWVKASTSWPVERPLFGCVKHDGTQRRLDLREERADQRIRVTSVCSGFVDTVDHHLRRHCILSRTFNV